MAAEPQPRRTPFKRSKPVTGCGAEWLDMLRTGEKLVCAGLRREIGPEGDLRGAYRRWYEEQMLEHDSLLVQMYDRLDAAIAERH